MRPIRTRKFPCFSLVLLAAASAGCSVSRPQAFRSYFVPPAPQPSEPAYVIPAPPVVETGLMDRARPRLLVAVGASRRTLETQLRLGRAEHHFERGAELLAEGKPAEAREEFDAAVELLAATPLRDPAREQVKARLAEMVDRVHSLEMATVETPEIEEPVFDKAPIEEVVELTFPIDPSWKPKVKEQLEATVSQLPLETNDAVLSYINYFSSVRGKRILEAGIRRAGRYAPVIRRILDEEGVPQELIFMAQAESGFLPRAVSSKKATGMWQFVSARGKEYGLRQDTFIDERMDPEKATRAAARHLRDLYVQFGDWYLAMAAYNCGPMNVQRAVERTGYADFWELRKRNVLPRETANYVPVILAMIIMSKNARDYGIADIQPDAPLEYSAHEVDSPTHLALIAGILGRTLSEVQDLNPAVLKLVAPAGYAVRVPRGSANTLAAAMDAVPLEKRDSWRVHRVSSAETVAVLARQYKTTEKMIVAANGDELDDVREGDLLLIPVSYPGPKVTSGKSTRSSKTTRSSRTRRPVKSSSAAPAKTSIYASNALRMSAHNRPQSR